MPDPLTVLHCVAGNLYGGVETFLRTLAECRAVTPGLRHEFALCFEGRLSAELRQAGAVVHDLGEVRFSRFWTVWRARRRLAKLLGEGGPEVVVNHCCWPQMLCGATARKAGRPVVYWMHEVIAGDGHWVERGASKTIPDLVLMHSRAMASTLPRLYPKVRSEILRFPVQSRTVARADARRAIRDELGTPADDTVIVNACRLESWKGHPLLLSALGRLRDKPGWTAWIAGGVQRPQERAYLNELKAAASAGGIADRVRFLGHRDDVPRLFAAADIHCQPNATPEPFGIAFIEALYAGLPLVSTRMGGAAEIVTDACGLLIPPGDPAALAAALSSLCDDPSLRARLGAAGPARAAELCAPEAVLSTLDRLLHDVRGR